MSLSEEVELLRQIPLFAKIDPAKLKLLAFTSERITFGQGDTVCRQGEMGQSAHIVLDGTARVSIATDGGEIEVAKVGRGDVVGEIAILCDVPRTATVTADDGLVTLRIEKEAFFKLLNEFPTIAVEILRELAKRLERTNAQLREALQNNAAASST